MRCPNCQEIRTEFAFEAANVHGSVKLSDDEFAVLHCPSCDILFPRIKPSETYHQTYYPLNYYNSNRVGNNFLGKLYGYIFAKDITKFISKIINHGNILDFGCGNGNFLVEILIRKLNKGHNPLTALSTIFGVDIMVDSIQECKERLLNVLKERNIEITKKMIDVIQNNIICLSLDKYPRGSLDYDFSFNNLTKT